MSKFACVQPAPPIEVFALNKSCLEDTHPNKVNLGVGGKIIKIKPRYEIYLLLSLKRILPFKGNQCLPVSDLKFITYSLMIINLIVLFVSEGY